MPSPSAAVLATPEQQLVLAGTEECGSVLLSMQRMERRFNSKFQYPNVFLNNAAFEVVFHIVVPHVWLRVTDATRIR